MNSADIARTQTIFAIKKPPKYRTKEDLDCIFTFLHEVKVLGCLREPALRSICRTVRHISAPLNHTIYSHGDLSTCWYILLTGSVLIDNFVHKPMQSFGKRSAACTERVSDCVTMEPATMIKVDYPDIDFKRPTSRASSSSSAHSPALSGSAHSPALSGSAHSPALSPRKLGVICSRSTVAPSPSPPPPSLTDPRRPLDQRQPLDDHQTPDTPLPSTPPPPTSRAEVCKQDNADDTLVRKRHRRSVSDPLEGSTDDLANNNNNIEVDEVGGHVADRASSSIDSDDDVDDDIERDGYIFKDTIREALEKPSNARTEQDITNLVEFLQQLIVFNNMTAATRRALCSEIQMCRVDVAGTIVLNHGEQLDSWSVLLNGHVEVTSQSGEVRELAMGESFGITATKEDMFNQGTMVTRSDNCHFICIPQEQYANILNKGEENIKCIYDANGGKIRYEEYRICDGGKKKGHVIIKALKSALIDHLIETHSIMDPTYVDDFLLTYRTFINDPSEITDQLLEWFKEPKYREKVIRVVLLWVNNHYIDFENNNNMNNFLTKFEHLLEIENLREHLSLLNIACAVKARKRSIVISRNSRKEVLQFNILGGLERGSAIFVSKVESESKAQIAGLCRGDQILEVNNNNFDNISHHRALEILRGCTHLSITVRSNMLGLKAFKEMLKNECPSTSRYAARNLRNHSNGAMSISSSTDLFNNSSNLSNSSICSDFSLDSSSEIASRGVTSSSSSSFPNANVPPFINAPTKSKDKQKYTTMGGKNRIRKAFERINFLSKNGNQNSMECADNVPSASTRLSSDDTSIITSHSHSRSTTLHQSTSNPDLTKLDLQMERNNFQMVAASQLLAVSGGSSYQHHQDRIQHVLKVFRADQTFKFFVVNLETSAHEVVMLALNEFCIVNEDSSNYSLFMVSVEPGMVIKQKRLPKQQVNLPEMITLNARYYLKNNVSTEPLVYGELLSNELVAEGQVSLLQLDASEVAAQLTLRDFNKFSSIHLTEYIDDIFDTEAKHKNSTQTLEKFAQLANDEMFWVITEICTETNMFKRMKIIKCFIRIAKYCKDCKNFNSMFALISGLGYGAVSRLRQTWDKLPSKYLRIFEDLQSFLNPTRNMSNYRNLANSIAVNPPSIPFFPIVKKDLTFIHLGNDTLVDGLVNFEKLRMISKEIRAISHMTSINYNKRDIYNESSKRRRNSTIPNIKKTYEENHMIRKVQAYLDKIVVVKDENDLDTFSTQCEGNNASGARRREQHSNDNLMTFAPKFGNNSPDAVRKLMSLSDKTLKVKMKPAQSSTTSSTGGGASGTAASAAGGVPSKSTLMRLSTQTPASVLKMPPVSPRLNSLPAKGIRLSSECSSVVATRKIRNSGSICSNDSRMSITSSAPSSSPLMACRTFPQGAITSDADSGHNSAVSSTSTASSVASSSELDQGSPRMPLRTADLLAEADVTDEESTLTRKSPLRTRPSIGSIQSVSSTSSCDRPTLPPYHVLLDNNPELGNYAKHKYNTTNDDAPKSCHPGYTMAPLYPTTSPRPLSEPQHKRVSSAAARLLKHSRSRDSAPFKTNIDQVLNDEDDSQVSAV